MIFLLFFIFGSLIGTILTLLIISTHKNNDDEQEFFVNSIYKEKQK